MPKKAIKLEKILNNFLPFAYFRALPGATWEEYQTRLTKALKAIRRLYEDM